MKKLATLLLLCLTLSLHAQVYTSNATEARMSFDGSLIKEATNLSGASALRMIQGQQELLIVFEMTDFKLADYNLEAEFNETFFETHYFPQLRMTFKLPAKINTDEDGSHALTVPARITLRKISVSVDVKLMVNVVQKQVFISFHQPLKLTSFQVPFAGPGSEIGQEMKLEVKGQLSPR